LAVIAAVATAMFVAWLRPWGASELSPRVTIAGIRGIQVQMSELEVTAVLGQPLDRKLRADGTEVLEFHRAPRAMEYPTVSVVLKEHRVTAVFVEVERFWGVDEDTIYLRTADQYFALPELSRWLPQ
jgi:hypothetical protein